MYSYCPLLHSSYEYPENSFFHGRSNSFFQPIMDVFLSIEAFPSCSTRPFLPFHSASCFLSQYFSSFETLSAENTPEIFGSEIALFLRLKNYTRNSVQSYRIFFKKSNNCYFPVLFTWQSFIQQNSNTFVVPRLQQLAGGIETSPLYYCMLMFENYGSELWIFQKYQRQQNTLYPKGVRFCENNFLKLLIGSQLITEGTSLICGRFVLHGINEGNALNSLRIIGLGVNGILLYIYDSREIIILSIFKSNSL